MNRRGADEAKGLHPAGALRPQRSSGRGGSRPKRRRRPRPRVAGVTLIELMVVVVLIAVASVAAIVAFGSLTKRQLRSSSLTVVAASRFAFGRATTTGNTVRIVLDLESNTMALEETEGTVSLSSANDERRQESDEEDTAAVDPWSAAQSRIEDTFEPTFGATSFETVRGRDNVALDKYKPTRLGVDIVRVYVPHEPEPVEEGVAAIYFFPSGIAEDAVVHLSDGRDTVYAVRIHPLTGRAEVFNHAFEPDELTEDHFDEEASDLRDPG
ncbi:MAG: prepilin-type N-terminal cleavage/methylation domain-containing protein [Myxococcota bacterium]